MLQLFYLVIFIKNTYKKKQKQKQNIKKIKVEIPQLFLNMTGTICVWKQRGQSKTEEIDLLKDDTENADKQIPDFLPKFSEYF